MNKNVLIAILFILFCGIIMGCSEDFSCEDYNDDITRTKAQLHEKTTALNTCLSKTNGSFQCKEKICPTCPICDECGNGSVITEYVEVSSTCDVNQSDLTKMSIKLTWCNNRLEELNNTEYIMELETNMTNCYLKLEECNKSLGIIKNATS